MRAAGAINATSGEGLLAGVAGEGLNVGGPALPTVAVDWTGVRQEYIKQMPAVGGV